MSEMMNVWGDECLRWWMSGWWMSDNPFCTLLTFLETCTTTTTNTQAHDTGFILALPPHRLLKVMSLIAFIHLNSSCPTDRDLYLTKNVFLILSYGKGHFVSLTSWPSMHHKWVWFETSFSSNKSHKFWDTRDLSWMNERDICFLTEFQTARGSYHLIFMFSLHCLVQTGM